MSNLILEGGNVVRNFHNSITICQFILFSNMCVYLGMKKKIILCDTVSFVLVLRFLWSSFYRKYFLKSWYHWMKFDISVLTFSIYSFRNNGLLHNNIAHTLQLSIVYGFERLRKAKINILNTAKYLKYLKYRLS